MMSVLPTTDRAVAYQHSLAGTLAAAAHLAALPQMPWQTLALNATFYLDLYLTGSEYRTALERALERAAQESRLWSQQAADPPIFASTAINGPPAMARAQFPRQLFDQAVAVDSPAQLVLAQHAAEMAEVLDDTARQLVFRFGTLRLPPNVFALAASAAINPVEPSALIERLSRAMLAKRVNAFGFADQLLMLHAANRAQELVDAQYSAPLAVAARWIAPLPLIQQPLRRVPIMQPHDLARRALACPNPRAVLMVEAGLVEAEALSNSQRFVIYAALDKALSGLATNPAATAAGSP